MHLNSSHEALEIKWKEERHVKVRKKGGVVYLTYPDFEKLPGFYHGFSTRLGGVSQGIYESMNLSFTRGDDDEKVLENYKRIADAIGFSLQKTVCADQTHTANIRAVDEKDAGKGIFREKDYRDIDGLVTNVPGITLCTSFADCVPLFFIDPVRQAVGLSHSGWRGTVGRIGEKTILAMKELYGSCPEDIYAAIGPSICQDCYEVSEDVAEAFAAEFSAHKEEKKLLYKKENGKYQLNLWYANEIILTEAGIRKGHLSMPGICTCCNHQFLYSHRASHGRRGNLCAFLGISDYINVTKE